MNALAKASSRLLRATPDFLIIGAQKAGTTSLFHYLASHPQTAPAAAKEIHFFNIYRRRGLAWYLSHFPHRHAKNGRLCFEATPDYLHVPEVPELIRRKIGRPKLVIVLREPAERAYSAWRMWRHYAEQPGKQDHRSFGQAIRDELADPASAARGPHRYVEVGRYADHLARYRTHFAAEDMLVLDYAELGRDFDGFMGRLCGFLGLRPFAPSELDALRDKRYWTARSRTQSPDDTRTLEALREHYRPHNARLRDEFNLSFGW